MKSLTKDQIQKAFENWNKAYTENPEGFAEDVKSGEEESYAEGQTRVLFKYAKV
jgi:hypothetical protein